MIYKTNNTKDRRDFLKRSSLTVAGTIAAGSLPLELGAYVTGKESIKLGLIGCGGRGNGAVVESLKASKSVKLIAMADVFQDQLDNSYKILKENSIPDQVEVPEENKFLGFDAYKKVIELSDAVILATPPGFRPMHFEACVNAEKHVFMEKPLAVDVPGYKKVIEAGKLADQKGVVVVVGLQNRYMPAYKELVKRVREGMIGDVVSTDAYYNIGMLKVVPRKEGQTEMEFQMRNWHYFTWLWGGHLSGLTIHQIDVVNWVKNDYPVIARGLGGRITLSGVNHGENYDHHYVEYIYPDGSRMHVQGRAIDNCWWKRGIYFQGTKGTGVDERFRIDDLKGNKLWGYNSSEDPSEYQIEQDVFINSILNGEKVNDTEYGAKSTMTTILGRMSVYSGQEIKLEDALNSNINLLPQEFSWDAELPNMPDENGNYEFPVPGKTTIL